MKIQFLKLYKITKRLFGAKTKGIVMAKEDVVAAGVAAVQAGEAQVLSDAFGVVYDKAQAEVPVVVGGGGFSQADIDAAVQASKDADAIALAQSQADDKKAFDDAKAASDAAKDDMQKKLDELALKEGQEASVIAGLKGSLQSIKDAEAALQALFPVVAPEPVPVPDPSPASAS